MNQGSTEMKQVYRWAKQREEGIISVKLRELFSMEQLGMSIV
jgi:hypothetical protein